MDQWYKNAIFYGIEVKTFYDGNGDGIGDFSGLTQKLDYLAYLGITCIWLLPFYPSGGRDNGYDVTDYYSIDPNYGTFDEFRTFIKEAEKRNIRVIIDLVVQHTSNLHPWFLEARSVPQSKYRDYFIWTKEIPEEHYPEDQPAFPSVEAGVWRFDALAKEFYFHRFYHFQPDLNIANRRVQEEIFNIVEFWLKLGIAGFRIDATKLLFARKGKEGTEVTNAEEFLNSLNTFIKKINPEAIMLGEADIEPSEISFYFGNGQRMHLLYNFLLNRYLFLALARGDAEPMCRELQLLPKPPLKAQWVNFLRNLDELNLDQLTPEEQKEVYDTFAPKREMKIYNRGIRRRLAPMFNGDMRRLKMAYNLIFALPGAAILVYGEEIGMGDNLDLLEREAVRIPMQWDDALNAGFSTVNPKGLVRLVLSEGHYGYQSINVTLQKQDEGSLLHHIRHLVAIRKLHQEIGHGVYKMVAIKPASIFGIAHEFEGDITIVIINLSAKPVHVQLTEYKNAELEEFFSDGVYFQEEKGTAIPLNGYGYRWFKVKRQ